MTRACACACGCGCGCDVGGGDYGGGGGAYALAARLRSEAGTELPRAVDLAYRLVLSRPPEVKEKARSLAYLENDPQRLSRFAWLLFNLDEFIHVP